MINYINNKKEIRRGDLQQHNNAFMEKAAKKFETRLKKREKENVMMPRSLNLSCLKQCLSSAADQIRKMVESKS